MKKLLITTIVAAVAAFQVSAITVTVDRVPGYFLAGSGAGEFNVSPITGTGYGASDMYNNTLGGAGFGTFCVNENASMGQILPGTYDATIIPSGIDPTSGSPITKGTAWLFSQFATGAMTDYQYNTLGVLVGQRGNDAFLLQTAIWMLEGTYTLNTANKYIVDVTTQFGTLAGAEADNAAGGYSVGVLGLTYVDGNGNTVAAQPMLTLLPDGGSALLLLGMGLSGLALVSRKVRA